MKKAIFLGCVLALIAALTGCDTQTSPPEIPTEAAREQVVKAAVADINDLPLEEDDSLYSEYDPIDPVCFYITVVGGNAADDTDHTFAQVNSYLNLQGMSDVEKIKTDVIFQVGDEIGPLPGAIGYDAVASNATINVRGRTSTRYQQKSYRIDLFDTAGLWRGQRAIAINKHPGDNTRLRNMLFFELLQDVPGMTSLRTQFVHVYIKDLTDPDAEDAFVDYGLYTQVELPNGRYLLNHGLSRNGDLYKANLCEMYRYEDKLRLATDPLYDPELFSQVLEPKTTQDHAELLEMLDAVNDYSIPIEEVVDRYFNIDNLTSYLAFNILMGNPDSNAQNYLLYRPVNSDTWYYICWDGDGALSYYEDELLNNAWIEGSWTKGISCYWGVVLFNRILRVPSFREALTEKVEALHGQITSARIAALIAKYRVVVDQYTSVMPDSLHMEVPADVQELIDENLPYDTDRAYEYYMESLHEPMPFYLGVVAEQDGSLSFPWSAAYDFDAEFVRYDMQIATDWSFAEDTIVYESLGQLATETQAPIPAPGVYYWRVIAENESGFTQVAFDQIITGTGAHSGMRRFEIHEDGTVTNTQ